MELKKIVLGVALAMGVTTFAQAAGEPVAPTAPTDQGSGSVTFHGAIIDAPCSISSKTVNQTVEMGSISNVALANGGKSTMKSFSIDLEQCNLTDKYKTVTVTFNGNPGPIPESMTIQGITGAALVLVDGNNKKVEMNKPAGLKTLSNGSNQLEFTTYVQGDATADTIDLGEFNTTAGFTLAYQ